LDWPGARVPQALAAAACRRLMVLGLRRVRPFVADLLFDISRTSEKRKRLSS
jgi:hypothetical protein